MLTKVDFHASNSVWDTSSSLGKMAAQGAGTHWYILALEFDAVTVSGAGEGQVKGKLRRLRPAKTSLANGLKHAGDWGSLRVALTCSSLPPEERRIGWLMEVSSRHFLASQFISTLFP